MARCADLDGPLCHPREGPHAVDADPSSRVSQRNETRRWLGLCRVTLLWWYFSPRWLSSAGLPKNPPKPFKLTRQPARNVCFCLVANVPTCTGCCRCTCCRLGRGVLRQGLTGRPLSNARQGPTGIAAHSAAGIRFVLTCFRANAESSCLCARIDEKVWPGDTSLPANWATAFLEPCALASQRGSGEIPL